MHKITNSRFKKYFWLLKRNVIVYWHSPVYITVHNPKSEVSSWAHWEGVGRRPRNPPNIRSENPGSAGACQDATHVDCNSILLAQQNGIAIHVLRHLQPGVCRNPIRPPRSTFIRLDDAGTCQTLMLVDRKLRGGAAVRGFRYVIAWRH